MLSPLVPFPAQVTKLRALFNAISATWKNANPKVTAWLDEATVEIDKLRAHG